MASRSAPARSRYYHRFSVAHGSRPPRCCTPSGLEQTPFAQKALMNWRCRLLKAFIAAWRNHQHNKKLETSAAEHVLINDHSHQFSLLTYYIGKKDQLEQLLSHGFDVIDIY